MRDGASNIDGFTQHCSRLIGKSEDPQIQPPQSQSVHSDINTKDLDLPRVLLRIIKRKARRELPVAFHMLSQMKHQVGQHIVSLHGQSRIALFLRGRKAESRTFPRLFEISAH